MDTGRLADDLQAWLRRQYGATAQVGDIFVYPGGASNLTCRVALVGAPWEMAVLRVQRERGIFEPYDVLREARVLRGLAASEVPVPKVYAQGDASAGLGAPFVLLECVDAPHMGEAPPGEASFPAFAAMVARLHGLPWRELGFGWLGVPATPAAGVLAELAAIEARRARFVPAGEPLLKDALARLAEAVPDDGRLGLCQGDINVFNYLVRGGQVVSVVDWEQARISDPRSDVGQLIALSHLKGAPWGPADQQPFAQVYRAAGGAAEGLAFFRARWLADLGVITYGWRAFNGSEPWWEWDHLVELLGRAIGEL
ncbi:MAG: phosphotransferase family protein [Dehalococcoidia bacterium]